MICPRVESCLLASLVDNNDGNSSDQNEDETRLTRAQRRRGLGKLDAVVDKLQDTKSEDSA